MSDLVPSLLRTVARDFHDTRAVIVLDAVLVHHVLSDRELVSVTGIGLKEVRATCARLREDHLLKEVSHRDESGIRAYTHTVFYIHFTEAIDAIKWKMHMVETKLREELNHQHNTTDYVCDTCGRHYEAIDALTLFDAESQQFICDLCGSPLRENDPKLENEKESDKEEGSEMEEFMLQLRPVLATLKAIDEITVPDNTFESELQQHVPLIGFENTGPQSYNLPPHLGGNAVTAPKTGPDSGITIAGSSSSRLPQQVESTFQINITSEAEQQSQQAEAQREKQRLAEENALPEWHSQSTVSTNIATKNEGISETAKTPTTEVQESASQQTERNPSAVDAYFQQLQAQQGDEEEEEEDEDEFEDVV